MIKGLRGSTNPFRTEEFFLFFKGINTKISAMLGFRFRQIKPIYGCM